VVGNLGLFSSGFAIKSKRPLRKIVIASIDFARAEICAVEKHLQASGRFNVGFARR
jgi:hypothetical protein